MFRYYFINVDTMDQVVRGQFLHCDDDAQARTHADKPIADSDNSGAEVWDHDRRVYRSKKPRSAEGERAS